MLIPLLGDFHSAYLLVPFLSWVPNLVAVELLLAGSPRPDRVAGRVTGGGEPDGAAPCTQAVRGELLERGIPPDIQEGVRT